MTKWLAAALLALTLVHPREAGAGDDHQGMSLPTRRSAGPELWRPAPGYEVDVSDPAVVGQAYQSPDFRSLLVLLEPGDEAYILSLTDRKVSSVKSAEVDYTDHGARPKDDAAKTPAGAFTQNGADIAFTAGALKVVLSPQPPLTGPVTLDQILKRKLDYVRAAAAYTPDSTQVARIHRHAKPVEIVVFFGTWCGSCRAWMPKFIKTMELADNPEITVRYIAVAEEYKAPRDLIEKYDMHLTPSFIVMDGTREVGRIKGKPTLSVERDLAELLAGQ